MALAADYPFLDILWTMILFFFWIAWICILVMIIGDLFRRDDASGWTKALWVIFLIFLPFLGVLIYMIANGRGMSERNIQRHQESEAQFAGYVKSVAGSDSGAAGEIAQAKSLLDSGAITQAEFDSLKAKALAA